VDAPRLVGMFMRGRGGTRFTTTTPVSPVSGGPGMVEEQRRLGHTGVLGAGSIACPRCDAPVSIGTEPRSPAATLSCPYCRLAAPLREFLSLATPTRPARVVVQVRLVA
jgi:hypothetical protein